MNTPNESPDPLKPAYPETGTGNTGTSRTPGSRSGRNIALLVILGVVILLTIFFLGHEEEKPADEGVPPATVEQGSTL